MSERYLFTSESVSMGHPDKVADQISDAVLDFCLAARPDQPRRLRDAGHHRPRRRRRRDHHQGRPSPATAVDKLVRDTIREIGYIDPKIGFAADTCQVDRHLHAQSPHIAMGVDTGGAGDQGMMFGFACDETRP